MVRERKILTLRKLFLAFRLHFFLSTVGLVLLGGPSTPAIGAGQVDLYELWERQVANSNGYSNPFDFNEIELQANFISPTGKKKQLYGFYDGDGRGGQEGNVWKLRFMPDETGTWSYTYTWTDGTPGGSGHFVVGPRADPGNHGHVRVDPKHPQYLVHDDGTPHYWFGGKWFDGKSDLCNGANVISYLDLLADYRHNGILVKHSLFPLQDDRRSFDLQWLNCREDVIREAQRRGIYVQVNFFDTWSRKQGRKKKTTTDGKEQVVNVWNEEQLAEKEFYVRYLVARYAGFSNVYWELGNEMEHRPNPGPAFVSLANRYYIPWIRRYDPYNLPIGLSEGVGLSADVDIHFVHSDDKSLPPPRPTKPWLKNELVPGWQDEIARDPDYRFYYRRVFWKMFTYGGCGSSEATWLRIEKPLGHAVRNVMKDQMRLRKFINGLATSINEMSSDSGIVTDGPGSFQRTRYKEGREYITYFYLEDNGGIFSKMTDLLRRLSGGKKGWGLTRSNGASTEKGNISVNLPDGKYEAAWIDPKNGIILSRESFIASGGATVIAHPAFTEDVVLHIVVDNLIDDSR